MLSDISVQLPEGDARSSKLTLATTLSPAASSLLSQLLVTEPSARPSASALRKHEFFARIDWNKMSERRLDPPFKPAVFAAMRVRGRFFFFFSFFSFAHSHRRQTARSDLSETVLAPNVPIALAGFTVVEHAPTLHQNQDTLTKPSLRR